MRRPIFRVIVQVCVAVLVIKTYLSVYPMTPLLDREYRLIERVA